MPTDAPRVKPRPPRDEGPAAIAGSPAAGRTSRTPANDPPAPQADRRRAGTPNRRGPHPLKRAKLPRAQRSRCPFQRRDPALDSTAPQPGPRRAGPPQRHSDRPTKPTPGNPQDRQAPHPPTPPLQPAQPISAHHRQAMDPSHSPSPPAPAHRASGLEGHRSDPRPAARPIRANTTSGSLKAPQVHTPGDPRRSKPPGTQMPPGPLASTPPSTPRSPGSRSARASAHPRQRMTQKQNHPLGAATRPLGGGGG